MVAVYIGTFDKKINSTARPDTSQFTQYNCEIKANTSMTAPTLIIATGNLVTNHGNSNWNNPGVGDINYCYIPLWKRYYFIRDISFGAPNSEIICTIDVLATYKTNIGSSTQYVLRSASNWDGTIVDTLYPATTTVQFAQYAQPDAQPNFATKISQSDGVVSVGIIGGSGSTTFYLMRLNSFYTLMGFIMSDEYAQTALENLSITVVGREQAKLLVDPLQYITAITYFPFIPSNMAIDQTSVNVVEIGYVAFLKSTTIPNHDYTIYRIDTPLIYRNIGFDVSLLPKHPQAARGVYLNHAPYTQIEFYFPGIGAVSIDPDIFDGMNQFQAQYKVDLNTGDATIRLFTRDSTTDNTHLYTQINTKLGVNFQLSQVRERGMGLVDIVAGIAGTISNPINALGFVGNAIESKVPHAKSVGSTGSFAGLDGVARFYYTFYMVVDQDLANNGAPLCKNVIINTLAGYVKCDHTHISLTGATAQEKEQVINYMNGGFYYE